jgi:CDP-paratose 2-epimerase
MAALEQRWTGVEGRSGPGCHADLLEGSRRPGRETGMTVAVITGAAGLIGSEAAMHFGGLGLDIVGIDNDMRRVFFGPEGSTAWNRRRVERLLGTSYTHAEIDIRDRSAVAELFGRYGRDIGFVVHTAAQPSHDWAAGDPFTDFDVNAVGTVNLLEATRRHCPTAPFIFTSTNKVYGDRPNSLPLVELDTRWEIADGHDYERGIREDMSIDMCLHSVFGASKVAADVMVQEYGRYFQIPTACFRGGTLTGPKHSAAQLHGFLGYVMRCAMTRTPYTVFGYQGKQVRDAIHAKDLINAFDCFWRAPRVAEAYNIGGGRFSNCSVLEAISMTEKITGEPMDWTYSEANRVGDHIWWIGDNGRFEGHFPDWRLEYNVEDILTEIFEANAERWSA